MAHSRRRYAGAVALSGTFAACLATPHPSRGDGGVGAGGDGSIVHGSRCDSPVVVDPFTSVPAGCVRGSTSASIAVSNGMLTEQGSGADDPKCTWQQLPGFGVGFVVEIVSIATNGAPAAYAEIAVATATAGTTSFGLKLIPTTMEYNTVVDGNSVGPLPARGYYLTVAAPDDHTIVLEYTATFSPDLSTWTFVASKTLPAGATDQPVDVTLDLPVQTSSFASATFKSLERCP